MYMLDGHADCETVLEKYLSLRNMNNNVDNDKLFIKYVTNVIT